jgi:hypothetical protein
MTTYGCAAASSRAPVFQALRARTATWYAPLAEDGVHAKVFVVDHAPASTQLVPLNSTNWYWYGASPPLALAVHVMVVPGARGAATLGVSVRPVTTGLIT